MLAAQAEGRQGFSIDGSELPRVGYALAADDRPDGFGYLLKPSLNDVDQLTASVRRVALGGVAAAGIAIGTMSAPPGLSARKTL
jgi:hypothetical protein